MANRESPRLPLLSESYLQSPIIVNSSLHCSFTRVITPQGFCRFFVWFWFFGKMVVGAISRGFKPVLGDFRELLSTVDTRFRHNL